MTDLDERLREAVDSTTPIEISEIQSRTVVIHRSRRRRSLFGVSAVAVVTIGIVVAAIAGVFSPTPINRVSTAYPSTGVSSSVTRDRVTVTISIPTDTYRIGESIRGRLVFDNRSGHPFANGDACPGEGFNVELVGHGLTAALPSGVGCTQHYLLPNGITTEQFTVSTTPGSQPPISGMYQLDTWIYPQGLPSPPPLRVHLVSAVKDMVGGDSHAHTVTIGQVTVILPAGWYAAAVPVDPSSMGYELFVASSAPLVTECRPLTIHDGRPKHSSTRVESCHFLVPTARPNAVSMGWGLDAGPFAGHQWPFKQSVGGRPATIIVSHAHGTCDGTANMAGSVFGAFFVAGQDVITAQACIMPTHQSAQIESLLSILRSTRIHT